MPRLGSVLVASLILAAAGCPAWSAEGAPLAAPGPPSPPGLLGGPSVGSPPGPAIHAAPPPPGPLPGTRPPVAPPVPAPPAGVPPRPYDPAYGQNALMSEQLQVLSLQQQLGGDSPDLRQLRLDLANAQQRLDQYRMSQTPQQARFRRHLLDDSLRRLEMRRLRLQQDRAGVRPPPTVGSGEQ